MQIFLFSDRQLNQICLKCNCKGEAVEILHHLKYYKIICVKIYPKEKEKVLHSNSL